MSGFLWGVAAALALSLIVNLFDPSVRDDLRTAGRILLALPARLVLLCTLFALWIVGGRSRVYRVNHYALRSWLDTTDAQAMVIQRPHRNVLVFTKTRKETDR